MASNAYALGSGDLDSITPPAPSQQAAAAAQQQRRPSSDISRPSSAAQSMSDHILSMPLTAANPLYRSAEKPDGSGFRRKPSSKAALAFAEWMNRAGNQDVPDAEIYQLVAKLRQASLELYTIAHRGESFIDRIAAAGAIPELLRLLSHAASDLLLQGGSGGAQYGSSAAVPGLMQMMSETGDVATKHFITALTSLTGGSQAVRNQIVSSGAVPLLAVLLRHATPGVVQETCVSLANIAFGSNSHRGSIVQTSSTIPDLVWLMQHGPSQPVQDQALAAVANLTCGTEACNVEIVQAGGIAALVWLLKHPLPPGASQGAPSALSATWRHSAARRGWG